MTALDYLTDPEWDDAQRPPIEHPEAGFDDLTPTQQSWRTRGMVIVEGLIDDDTIDDYCAEWQANVTSPGGWPYCTPHRDHPALARLVCDSRIADVCEHLIGEPCGVHLTLTGWVTTTRDWHADSYLSPPEVAGHYVAVWIALDDITPDSGPFQWVEGSHRWPPLAQRKIRQALGADGVGPDWPRHSERILTPIFEDRIDPDDVVTYLPRKGDVLFWSSRLIHRGSRAMVPGTERRALIAHLSGLRHRPDMAPAIPVHGGFMFPQDDTVGLSPEQLSGGVA